MNQFRRRLFPSCAFLSRIFASFEGLADFALSFSRSFERLADFADFADFDDFERSRISQILSVRGFSAFASILF